MSLIYLGLMLGSFAIHKLLFKWADYVTSIPSKNFTEYYWLALLFTILFFADCGIINFLSDIKGIFQIEAKEGENYKYIGFAVSLDIITMLFALSINFIKFIVNSLEILSEKQFASKNIIFSMLDLLVQVANLFVQIILTIITLMKFDIYPVFVVASLFQSAFEIVKIFMALYLSISMASKLKALPELTYEQIEE